MTAAERARLPAIGLLAAGVALPLLGHPGLACPLRTMTGIPCPLCGMSTSVQATVRGRWDTAAAANPMGIALVLAALAVIFGARYDLARLPRWVPLTVLSTMWIFQLVRFEVI